MKNFKVISLLSLMFATAILADGICAIRKPKNSIETIEEKIEELNQTKEELENELALQRIKVWLLKNLDNTEIDNSAILSLEQLTNKRAVCVTSKKNKEIFCIKEELVMAMFKLLQDQSAKRSILTTPKNEDSLPSTPTQAAQAPLPVYLAEKTPAQPSLQVPATAPKAPELNLNAPRATAAASTPAK